MDVSNALDVVKIGFPFPALILVHPILCKVSIARKQFGAKKIACIIIDIKRKLRAQGQAIDQKFLECPREVSIQAEGVIAIHQTIVAPRIDLLVYIRKLIERRRKSPGAKGIFRIVTRTMFRFSKTCEQICFKLEIVRRVSL
ncbi:hypothetical protein D3C73_816140 [compost metagenome]